MFFVDNYFQSLIYALENDAKKIDFVLEINTPRLKVITTY